MRQNLEELYSKMTKTHYKGKPTKIKRKIDELSQKMDSAMFDIDRFKRMLCGIK